MKVWLLPVFAWCLCFWLCTAVNVRLNEIIELIPSVCYMQAVIALMEMGFDEKEVIDALRVNNNQQDAAVSHSHNDHQ